MSARVPRIDAIDISSSGLGGIAKDAKLTLSIVAW
jgi:hypothetical protein